MDNLNNLPFEVTVYNETRYRLQTKKLVEIVRLAKKIKLNISNVVLVITSDKRIKDLNRLYRNKNYATDVLSFKYDSGIPSEIFISYAYAKKQAKLYHHSVQKEMETLLAHGVVHLAGYDHKSNVERDKMDKIVNRLVAQQVQ